MIGLALGGILWAEPVSKGFQDTYGGGVAYATVLGLCAEPGQCHGFRVADRDCVLT